VKRPSKKEQHIMMRITKLFAAVALALALCIVPGAEAAGVNSNVATIGLTMTVQEFITVVPSTQSQPLTTTDGKVYGGSGASITTTWLLNVSRTNLTGYAYFTTPYALVDAAGDQIALGLFSLGTGTVSGGPCNQAGPFSAAGTCPVLFSINPGVTGNRTDNFNFGTSNLGTPNPGTYTGVLNIQVVAI
jgi:hypothetical protein